MKIISFLHPRYHPKIIGGDFLKNVQKAHASVLMALVINDTENETENLKNRSQRYDIKWPRSRHGNKYTKYKMCLSIMSVFWATTHEVTKLY